MALLRRKKTVENIVAPITRIVDELHAHASTNMAAQAKHAALADDHMTRAQGAGSEAAKAVSTADKIASLIN